MEIKHDIKEQDKIIIFEILREVRDRLSDANSWCQDGEAKNKNGIYCSPLSQQAAKWSLRGITEKILFERNIKDCVFQFSLEKIFNKALKYFLNRLTTPSIEIYQDEHSHSELLQVLDFAIWV